MLPRKNFPTSKKRVKTSKLVRPGEGYPTFFFLPLKVSLVNFASKDPNFLKHFGCEIATMIFSR